MEWKHENVRATPHAYAGNGADAPKTGPDDTRGAAQGQLYR